MEGKKWIFSKRLLVYLQREGSEEFNIFFSFTKFRGNFFRIQIFENSDENEIFQNEIFSKEKNLFLSQWPLFPCFWNYFLHFPFPKKLWGFIEFKEFFLWFFISLFMRSRTDIHNVSTKVRHKHLFS